MAEQITITKSKLILVEGPTDKAFFQSLVNFMRLENQIQIEEYGGKDRLGSRLLTITLASSFKQVASVGIVRDADDNPASSFQSVQSALERANLAQPPAILSKMTGPPNVAVMIMPDENSTGALETLCTRRFSEDKAMKCVDSYIRCLDIMDIYVSENTVAKAKMQTYLASKDEGELAIRFAVHKSWWNWNHPAFGDVRHFVELVATP